MGTLVQHCAAAYALLTAVLSSQCWEDFAILAAEPLSSLSKMYHVTNFSFWLVSRHDAMSTDSHDSLARNLTYEAIF